MSYNFDNDQNHYYFNNKNSLPIIFIHGVGLNQQMWKPQIEFFKNNSFITYDLLGHGKTPFNSQELTMENFTDQLSNLVNNLNIEKFNLIGFSIGSLIAIEFASKYEKYLNSLTLISTTYKRTTEERQSEMGEDLLSFFDRRYKVVSTSIIFSFIFWLFISKLTIKSFIFFSRRK